MDALAVHEGPVVLGIGDSAARRRVGGALGAVAWLEAVVHPRRPSAATSSSAEGTVVAAGARLTTHIAVGPHGYVGPNATIGHDTTLGRLRHRAPRGDRERVGHPRATAS